jgi:hypothetical protein
LVRNDLPSKLIKHTPHATWVEVQYGRTSIAVGGAYVHPYTSTYWGSGISGQEELREAAFTGLRSDITSFKESKDHVILMGDFNARVGPKPDIDATVQAVLDHMGFESEEVISTHVPSLRHSTDMAPTDTFGHLLIDHCCIETGCVLLNGRAPGDEQGECTRGLACLDYAITDACTYSSVESFKVCLPAAEVSDHLALECILALSNDAPASPASAFIGHVKPLVPRYDPAKREQYVEALRGGSAWGIITSISSGLQDGTLDPIVAAGQLSKLIMK